MNGPSSSIALVHPFPSSFCLSVYVWRQRTTCRNRFSPSIISGIEFKSVLSASLSPSAEPSCSPGSGLSAFQTLALQLQTSHVLESRFNGHRLPPSDFQRHCFPCTVEEASSKCGRSHFVCLVLLLPHPTAGLKPGFCPCQISALPTELSPSPSVPVSNGFM